MAEEEKEKETTEERSKEARVVRRLNGLEFGALDILLSAALGGKEEDYVEETWSRISTKYAHEKNLIKGQREATT